MQQRTAQSLAVLRRISGHSSGTRSASGNCPFFQRHSNSAHGKELLILNRRQPQMVGKHETLPLRNQGQWLCGLHFLHRAVSETGKFTVRPTPVVTDTGWISSKFMGIWNTKYENSKMILWKPVAYVYHWNHESMSANVEQTRDDIKNILGNSGIVSATDTYPIC